MSRRTLDDTLTCITRLDKASSPAQIADVVIDVARPFGFSHVLAGIIPVPGMSAEQQISNVVLHRWPKAWSERYFTQGYLFDDPTIQRVNTSTEPFLWSELEPSYRNTPAPTRVMGEAREFNLGCGFTVPMITLDGQAAGFSLASERADVPPKVRRQLQLIAMHAFARALAQKYNPAPVNLTPREMDILQWMAEGKSDWEIGVILKVSEHFVDKIARQLRAKLNATNRTQTVATALRHNLIR
ncbi:LuxR family transcriptional regulator [Nitrobacter sp.]|uniref:helix-turn-helix transcriptional regulator n=1 Tax=Nitrobacter sp. TaxID=29420 RepID=UPI001D4EF7F5|nr:LuxR family transcriptional regulator [Nitrobacter sp.]MCB1391710.1 LuxR family transcriptional regulator [Nitrobacter sp.]MCV0384933.1 LuxR family transcriptional regulator [Nitrobacter sp.]